MEFSKSVGIPSPSLSCEKNPTAGKSFHFLTLEAQQPGACALRKPGAAKIHSEPNSLRNDLKADRAPGGRCTLANSAPVLQRSS
jgi:hypothetical protein